MNQLNLGKLVHYFFCELGHFTYIGRKSKTISDEAEDSVSLSGAATPFVAGSAIPVGAALKAGEPVFSAVIGGVARTSVTTAVGVGSNFVVAPIVTSLAKSAGIDPIWANDIGIGTGFATSIFTGGKAYKACGDGAEVEEVANHNLDQETIDKILSMPKGSRPDPSTYLSKEYIDTHLSQFNDGASIIMTKEQYINYVDGNSYIGIPDDGTQFVLPKSICDNIEIKANKNIAYYEKSLGFDAGHFEDGGGLVRIDINDVSDLNLRIPSGNEAGVNSHWLPGGYTDGGIPEAVSDLIPNVDSKVNIRELK